jgi:hypothetical protein
MPRYIWSKLNNLQVGKFAEYFVKMELAMYGFLVYCTEVDDRGIDFVARYNKGPFVELQVKFLCSFGCVFMHKEKFVPREHLYLALGLLLERQPPELYLIPSTAWENGNGMFVNHDYENLKSKPEWGLNISTENIALLEPYRFEKIVEGMIG